MRIRFCILAVLAALSVGLAVWAHGTVYAQREAVTAEQVVLQGIRPWWKASPWRCGPPWTGICSGRRRSPPDRRSPAIPTIRTAPRSAGAALHGSWGLRVDVMGDSGPTREGDTEDLRGMEKPYNDVAPPAAPRGPRITRRRCACGITMRYFPFTCKTTFRSAAGFSGGQPVCHRGRAGHPGAAAAGPAAGVFPHSGAGGRHPGDRCGQE